MKYPPKQILALVFIPVFLCATACAQNLGEIGVTLLWTVTTNLNGAGIRVAQPEAYDLGTTNWEVNPADSEVEQPVSRFTFFSAGGTANSFPNSLDGTYSGHANGVAEYFYGIPGGIATNVAHVDNYDANYFLRISESIIGPITNYTVSLPSTNLNDRVVNQSFEALGSTIGEQQAIDSAYDNYAARYNTLFVSGIGNGGPVNPPATCYNGIGVGAYGGSSSYGPTLDNGRAKPDITAPASETSFSTPQVAGAAAVLMQAGLRGDGGGATNSAADIRTVKALLLNGAIKPAGWTNIPPSPLDINYGAGVLDIFNSYKQLAGGENNYIVSTSVSTGGTHPPPNTTGNVGVYSGWDFNTNTSGNSSDEVNHYFFNVTNNSATATFTATATLAWNRQRNHTNINNLALFLYNAANSNLVVCSTSLVDNVQQVFVPQLPQGRYDLEVWKAGGTPGLGIVSAAETYALAWEFFSTPLSISMSGTNTSISWPVCPDGFILQTTTNLVPPIVWSSNNSTPVVTNNQNVVVLNATNGAQFFELVRP